MASPAAQAYSVEVYETVETNNIKETIEVTSVDKDGETQVEKVEVELPAYHTAPPWQLLWDDLKLFILKAYKLPVVVFPLAYPPRLKTNYPALDQAWVPHMIRFGAVNRAVTYFQKRFQHFIDPFYPSGEMDELYPSVGNLICLAAHTVLIATQLAFLLSLPFIATFPFTAVLPYAIAFVTINYLACIPLNSGVTKGILKSHGTTESDNWAKYEKEEWIFLNGVSVGSHWLQGNLNRLSRTFHRPITGVHNKTAGIIFDTIQCLVERCFYFGTTDTRECYALIAGALTNPVKDRVVLILHSQGGLEGSIILDWLLSHCARKDLKKLEIYTFGNAANHFNNPKIDEGEYVVGHIEHYANDGDFVAEWGVTHFKSLISKQAKEAKNHSKKFHLHKRQSHETAIGSILGVTARQNNFSGLLFKNKGKWGHLLNQHYLDRILPLNDTLTGVVESKDGWGNKHFLDAAMVQGRGLRKGDKNKVANESRLWKYINGREPGMVNGN
ncbi:hypothetical protein CGCF415_v004075 [Colletotrichum fructicola]|uniref:Uncharacterized protein n=1 Tax=Colletotrichum fructicola (strain Nara gc5) TaxID=1213859 RepID=L2G6W4_COLFN|nr:uncharacterized protein CGMCC3_g4847 [Colletotrichum fructicola]KAF4489094.1 hypothetical protein CGGC5_v002999 [Colletotrichum fructicola Nara gc5]KAI8287687.1 hypothetical protein K4K60_012088 [Colletotrichum sp. SAR11_57]KAJ0350553.1 hypothetical protein KNSL1_003956 [Colletotrichum chrysophilum]KAE9579268.1 hypothetical protein CGMCC3_g4847 [Colletotrichum fructicola]KAF4432232.1 hypothetical protein CFRS1_v013072 [Colletotrichum fructicola]